MKHHEDHASVNEEENEDCSDSVTSKSGKTKTKSPLRLKLVRAFSSGSLRNPKSPDPTSSEQNSPMSFPGSPRVSPSRGSPVLNKPKSRSSWYNFTHIHRNRSSSSSLSTNSNRLHGDESLPESPYSPIEPDLLESNKSFVYDKIKSRRSWSNVAHPHRHRSYSSLSNSPIRTSPRSSVTASIGSAITSEELNDLRKAFADHKAKSRTAWYTIANPHRHRSYTTLTNLAKPSSSRHGIKSVPPSPCSPMTPKSAIYAKSVTDKW